MIRINLLSGKHFHKFLGKSSNNIRPLKSYGILTLGRSYHSTQSKLGAASKSTIIYEAPFAGVTLRLKRVSLSTAVVGFFGMPTVLYFQSGAIPIAGQLAVSGTALVAAIGSTALLNWCVTPYVHRIELENVLSNDNNDPKMKKNNDQVKATYANIFGIRKTITFDPRTEVHHLDPSGKKMFRPFVNFFVKPDMLPLYVHPELIEDKSFRRQLVGNQAAFKKI